MSTVSAGRMLKCVTSVQFGTVYLQVYIQHFYEKGLPLVLTLDDNCGLEGRYIGLHFCLVWHERPSSPGYYRLRTLWP